MHMIDLFIVPLGPKFTGNFCSNTRGLLDKTYASVVHETSG